MKKENSPSDPVSPMTNQTNANGDMSGAAPEEQPTVEQTESAQPSAPTSPPVINEMLGSHKRDLGQEFTVFNQQCDNRRHDQDFQFLTELKGIFNYICKTNPFYLLSACLILYAQTILFNITSENVWMDTCIPLTIMVLYTILMASAAVFIVRLGNVWDDARSIVLICLFLFMAVSVGLDGLLMHDYNDGFSQIVRCLAFTIILSEILVYGLPIKLPLTVRTVFYMILTVFFFYPCLPAHFLILENPTASNQATAWFPAICGLLYLTLIPIIRQGKALFKNNNTPWLWPFFPWTLFLITGIGICFRTYLLNLSFYAGAGSGPYSKMESGFGMYMLIPFLLCAMVLFLEHYIVTKQHRKQSLMMLGTLVFYAITLPSLFRQSPLFREFFELSYGYFGTPIFVAGIASIVFYLYCWIRKVRYADLALVATLALAAVFDLKTETSASRLGIPCILPWLCCAAYMIWLSIRKQQSLFAFIGSLALVIGVGLQMHSSGLKHIGIITFQLLVFLAFIVSILFNDKTAKAIRNVCSLPVALLFVLVVFSTSFPYPGAFTSLKVLYLLMLVTIDATMFFLFKNKFYLAAGLFSIASIALYLVLHSYNLTKTSSIRGSKIIFWGILSFIFAFSISLYKGKIVNKLIRKLHP